MVQARRMKEMMSVDAIFISAITIVEIIYLVEKRKLLAAAFYESVRGPVKFYLISRIRIVFLYPNVKYVTQARFSIGL